jgi:phosphoenolpyruvate synthase/pyruvate phosphate dikinase
MNKYKNYKLFYESHGYNFLLEDLIIQSYIKWGTLVVSVGDHVKKYVPEQVILEIKKKGLDITLENIIDAEQKIKDLISVISTTQISQETIISILENLSKVLEEYSLFDTTYSEGIYENNPLDERLEKVEYSKNVLRESFDSLFFGENSNIEKVLTFIVNSFELDSDSIHWYRKEEIISLLRYKTTVDISEIQKRKESYIYERENDRVIFFSGEKVKEIESLIAIAHSINTRELKGVVVSKSEQVIIRGSVYVLHRDHGDNDSFVTEMYKIPEGTILVTTMTDPAFLPIMKKSVAILTQTGGQLSHAAISARELKIPCLVGIENICSILKNGDMVEVNTNAGIINII